MTSFEFSYGYLLNESKSLKVRLNQLKPFTMTMPMVKGAQISSNAFKGITALINANKEKLYQAIDQYIEKVHKSKEKGFNPSLIQKDLVSLRLRFNSILDHLDIFADVLSQRSEHDVGIWLSGLDVLAEDGLIIGKPYIQDIPPMVVFLERGHGAAIRRARTRLPGGDENPVAVIQIPRERLIGNGIASSLIHEVGHQAAEILEITHFLRLELQRKVSEDKENGRLWRYFERWISEIIADYWAIGLLGVSATTGLMGVVTLPKYFQFRLELDDPHPTPYMRVMISCEFGNTLYPSSQWKTIWSLWESFYPTRELPEEKQRLINDLQNLLPQFIALVNGFKPESLNGKQLSDIFPLEERTPENLNRLFNNWMKNPSLIKSYSPTLVFAVIGQAKVNQELDADEEGKILAQQLRNWAYNRN